MYHFVCADFKSSIEVDFQIDIKKYHLLKYCYGIVSITPIIFFLSGVDFLDTNVNNYELFSVYSLQLSSPD